MECSFTGWLLDIERGTDMEDDYKEKIELLLDELDEKTLRRLWLITAVMVGCNRKESKDNNRCSIRTPCNNNKPDSWHHTGN